MKLIKILPFIFTIVIISSCEKDKLLTPQNNELEEEAEKAITYNSTHFASPGQLYYLAKDSTSALAFQLGDSGENVVWDYTALVENKIDTIIYEQPDIVTFGDATYSMFSSITQQTTAGQKTSTDVSFLGYNFLIPVVNLRTPIVFTDKEKILKFPSTYLTEFTDESSATVEQNIDTTIINFPISILITINYDGKVSSKFDSWGTVKTPTGEYKCIREHRTEIQNINIATTPQLFPIAPIVDTVVYYNYYSTSSGYPVVKVTMDAQSNVQYIHYLK